MPPQRGAAAELGAAALLVKRQGAAHRVGGATDDPGHIVLRVQLAGQQDDVAAPPDEGVGVVAIIVVERRPFLGAQEGCTSDSQGRSLPFQASQLSPPGSCNHNLLVGVPTCTPPAALFSFERWSRRIRSVMVVALTFSIPPPYSIITHWAYFSHGYGTPSRWPKKRTMSAVFSKVGRTLSPSPCGT